MKKLTLAAACAALLASSSSLWAQEKEATLGVRGMDHVGFTVPDIDQGVSFFRDVIGCEEAMRFGPFRDDEGTFMQDLVNVHPRAVLEHIAMMRCGDGSNIELFQYSAPDQKTDMPRNSDYGGFHIGFYVKDIKAAVDKAKALGLQTFMGPFELKEGPAAGQSITYVLTPWGMQLELISYPQGMAYEKDAKTKLWAPD
ncbi:VOC family protein [Pusillimonas sp. CC-YST705]|uniref:VOC family protein n=1 Tax=Mesopusillimonas faecipullorum TaxID=2755040 RepID=A0ABS8CD10_9BURK|nr:VOC family protein [Mesopusillimonas faecipullorum]MCB5363921.1 VOC family protein [Mesopusillimonas faecipullorum]